MTRLLLKLFVTEMDTPDGRARVGSLAGAVGIVCNLLLFLGKVLAGWLSGSVAIAADGFNNLSDAAASIVTLLGFRFSRKPADAHHPYGHARAEYLSGLCVAVLILFIGVELGKTSVSKIFSPAAVEFSAVTFWVLTGSIAMKLWMSLFVGKLGKLIGSGTLAATAADSRNDVIATAAVFIGCICQYFWSIPADGYMGLAVSGFILYSGLKSAKETISPLLGAQADETMIRQLSELILSHDKILGIHDLLVHDYGPGRCYASVHAEVSAALDPMTCHEILDHIEAEVSAKLQVQLVIHFDPIAQDDPELEQLQNAILYAIEKIDPALSIHDLRVVKNAKPPLICFDITAPYDALIDQEAVAKEIGQQLPPQWKQHKLSVNIDRA